MKYYLNLFSVVGLLAILGSCKSHNDDDEIQSIVNKKIDSVHFQQDTMTVFTRQTLKIFSSYSKNCEGFYGMDYIPKDSTRTVINYAYKTNVPCGSGDYTAFNIINFLPEHKGKYYFKFWQGKNTAGQNVWLEKQIVVK